MRLSKDDRDERHGNEDSRQEDSGSSRGWNPDPIYHFYDHRRGESSSEGEDSGSIEERETAETESHRSN